MSRKPSRRHTLVLGMPIASANMQLALRWIVEDLKSTRKGYVCFVNVHGLMESRRDPRFAETYRAAALRLPDGAPIAWVGRLNGERRMSRVAGPDLMLSVFADPRLRNATHYFYGGDEGVAQLLQQRLLERYPEAKIVGTFSPPFRELNQAEEQALVEDVRRLKPDMMWVGLGCPKQEQFMRTYLDRLDTRMMFGVGAAFEYHTGRINDSPEWVKRAGLQWIHRLLQDPRRLWKRYLVSNTAFVSQLLLEFLGLHAKAPARKEVVRSRHARVTR